MKFIVDAQLPRSLAAFIRSLGYDVLHTSELPRGNDTTDGEINRLSLSEKRTVISKDGDFYNSFTAKKEPYKLLHVRTGNITNTELLELFGKNFHSIVRQLEESDVVEIDQHFLISIR